MMYMWTGKNNRLTITNEELSQVKLPGDPGSLSSQHIRDFL